jgi:hypothetical protein
VQFLGSPSAGIQRPHSSRYVIRIVKIVIEGE